MPEITFIADPGADDILIDGVSVSGIDAFRAECLTSGAVSCDWDTLHVHLISHDVSRFWWFLTESERRSIADIAIRNTLFFPIEYRRSGEAACAGGTGEWKNGVDVCHPNVAIRYLKFASVIGTNNDACYWKRTVSGDEVCFVPEFSYGLPCGHVSRLYAGGGHGMCGIQVGADETSVGDWVIFQYYDSDIQPGNYQLPCGSMVTIYKPQRYTNCGGTMYKERIVLEVEV